MLKELDEALFSHFGAIMESIQPLITADKRLFTLVDDEQSDIQEMERLRAGLVEAGSDDEARVIIPFMVLQRDQFEYPDTTNPASVRFRTNDVILSKDTNTGDARILQFGLINILYNLRIYDDNFERLSDLTEFWLLNTGGNFCHVDFDIPEADGESIRATVTLEPPEAVSRTIEEIRESGLLFRMSLPLKIRVPLVGNATDAKIILTNIKTITVL